MMRVAITLVLPLLLVGARTDPLAGRIAGPPVDCIDFRQAGGPDIVDAATILYRQSGRRIWKTEPVGACPSLRPLSTLIVDVHGGRLCRDDRFRVLQTGTSIPSGYCRFAAFTPYDRR